MGRRIEGDLNLRHEPLPGDEERTVPVLRVLGPSKRMLFDPRVVRIIAGTIVFAGLERVDGAWYAQEWSCESFEQRENSPDRWSRYINHALEKNINAFNGLGTLWL